LLFTNCCKHTKEKGGEEEMTDKEEKDMISLKHTQDIANLELRFAELKGEINENTIGMSLEIEKSKNKIAELEKEMKELKEQIKKLGGETSASKTGDITNLMGEKPSNNTDSKPPSCEFLTDDNKCSNKTPEPPCQFDELMACPATSRPSEQDEEVARQTDYSHAECSRQKAVFSLTSLRGCSGRIEGIWDTRECYDCLYNPNYIPVETEDLEFIFSKDPEFMNLEELRRRKEIEEKYLPEKEEKEK